MGVYTIRDVDERTKRVIANYAHEHGLNIAEALRQLVLFASQHLHFSKRKKRFNTLFEIYQEIRFKSDRNLARDHDKVAYEL